MSLKTKIKKQLKNMYQDAFRLRYGVKSNKVLFESFSGKSYSDNPKVISEQLHLMCPEAEIVWFFNDPDAKKEIVPDYVRCVYRSSRRNYWQEVSTCKVMVTNFLLPEAKKSKKQYFIQTWHGDRAFKKVLLDGTHDFVPEQVEGYCDLAIAGSDYGEKQYRSAFGYTGRVLKVGTPRDDRFISPSDEEINAIKSKLGVSPETKIVLYAPTLRDKARDDGVAQKMQDISISETLNALREKYGCDWVCLLRAHPGVIALSGFNTSEELIDVSGYEDMNDLLLVSDILITDYSSSAGDFALLNRPLILFQADIEDYVNNTRALYFDISDSPYFSVKSQEELCNLINRLTEKDVIDNCKEILDFYGTVETGNSAVEVSKIIIEQIRK